ARAAEARALGADAVLDYRAGPPEGSWDAILDVIGSLPYHRARKLLAPGGRLLPVTASLGQQIGAALRPRRGDHRISGGIIADSKAAMERLIGLHRAGHYRPVIGETFPLAEIGAAHALAGSFHKRGNVVVIMP
ncbi:MAG: zinc-binding dehydrogenase, partial [Tabrizicola sp.]|nr:zinc-binding dehydrogenase [Tabrizicola sp.]